MSQYAPEKPRNIVPFEGSTKEANALDVDRCGEATVSLLQQAAQAAHANEERAAGIARKLSAQLKATEDRVAQLEAELQHAENRAVRAEKWLLHISQEIEDKFFQNENIAPNAGRTVVQR
jgi:hypothetical protein